MKRSSENKVRKELLWISTSKEVLNKERERRKNSTSAHTTTWKHYLHTSIYAARFLCFVCCPSYDFSRLCDVYTHITPTQAHILPCFSLTLSPGIILSTLNNCLCLLNIILCSKQDILSSLSLTLSLDNSK